MPSLTPRSSPLAVAGRRRTVLLATATLLGAALLPAAFADAPPVIAAAAVSGSPFASAGAAMPRQSDLTITLAEPASVTVTVVDYGQQPVRTLATSVPLAAGRHAFSWDGRDGAGRTLPNGYYRFVASAARSDGPAASVERGVTMAAYPLYSPKPGAITIALDPGHGGSDSGAVRSGSRESDFNLDIALRLRAMLVGAGATVIGPRPTVAMTRTTDVDVNRPIRDVNGDGFISLRDELAARIDVANLARADLFISLHNNSCSCTSASGTEVWTSGDHPWIAENLRFAALADQEIVARLRSAALPGWREIDRGVRRLNFYVTAPYEAGRVPRPSLMPTILGESLFLSNPGDLAMLRSPRGRQAIAEGYYNAIARYLAGRSWAARYDVTRVVTEALDGSTFGQQVRLTNRGMATWPAGTRMEVRAVPAVPLYDGSPERGTLLGSVPVPALAPGAAALVWASFAAPPAAGSWLLKFDLWLPGVGYLSDRGVVVLQLPLRTAGPPPSASPSPSASAPANPEAAPPARPSAGPSPSNTAGPTPAVVVEPTPTPAPAGSASASPDAPSPAGSPSPTPDAPSPAPSPT